MSDTIKLDIPHDAAKRIRIQDESVEPFRERILEIIIRYGARHAVQDVLVDALAVAMARFRASETALLRAALAEAQDMLSQGRTQFMAAVAKGQAADCFRALYLSERDEARAALAEAERKRDELRAKIELAHDRLCLLPEECDLVTACEHAMNNALESDTHAQRAEAELAAARDVIEFCATFSISDSNDADVAEDSLHEVRKAARAFLERTAPPPPLTEGADAELAAALEIMKAGL